MKTLLIDNYDSFTYNLYQLISEVNGQEPWVVKNDISWQALLAEHIQHDFDNVVISPGPGNPARPKDCGIVYKAITDLPLPILGICLGFQAIGYHFGADVVSAPEIFHGRTSEILHYANDPLFRAIPEQFTGVRYHSLILSKPLPKILVELACTQDGISMAMRHKTLPLWGVQFHPESILSEYGAQLLTNFRDITARYQHGWSFL